MSFADILNDPELFNSISKHFNLTEYLANVSAASANGTAEDDVYDPKPLLNYYLMGVGGTTVCCLGIVCNILSVIVLTRRVMNSSTYSYLAALAICDTLTLAMTLFLLTKDTKRPVKDMLAWDEPYYAYMFPYVHPAAVTFQVTSIWLTLAFTVDRYIMICHPFKAEKLCSVSRARKVVVGIYILGLAFNIPRFLEYRTDKTKVPKLDGSEEMHVVIGFTEIGNTELFRDLVHSWLYLICVCLIPFLTMAVMNSFLIRAVQQSRKKGRQINAKDKKRNDTTVMLIGVIVIFFICQGPALISRMVYAIDIHYATSSMAFHIINEVGNFLVIINSAINIVPYYFFGKKFRQEFWRLFCKCFLSKDELRRITRSLSFSIDNRRRISVASNNSGQEDKNCGSRRESDNVYNTYNGFNHKDSIAAPLIQGLKEYRNDSLAPAGGVPQSSPQTSGSGDKKKSRRRSSPPIPLRVKWVMDSNKNEKYNISIEVQPPSSSGGDV